MTLVVDASVAVKWFVKEAGSEDALALVGRDDLAAPSWIVPEVVNTLWKLHRREIIVRGQAEAGTAEIFGIIDSFHAMDALAGAGLSIALSLDHSPYDCFYLALAERLGCGMVTADRRLVAKVAGTEWRDRVRLL